MGRFLALLGALALFAPASALAQGQIVPPGNSEADQYSEAVPGADGNHVPDGEQTPDDVLSEDQVDDLNSLGPDGEAAAAIAAATAPPEALEGAGGGYAGGEGGSGASGDDGEPGAGTAADSGLQPGASASSVATPGDGLGSTFWAILIATTFGALVYALSRWWAGRRA